MNIEIIMNLIRIIKHINLLPFKVNFIKHISFVCFIVSSLQMLRYFSCFHPFLSILGQFFLGEHLLHSPHFRQIISDSLYFVEATFAYFRNDTLLCDDSRDARRTSSSIRVISYLLEGT